VGADLAGMADAATMWTGVHSHFFVLIFGVAIAWATIRCRGEKGNLKFPLSGPIPYELIGRVASALSRERSS
jgi:hypothetical protein